MRVLSLCSGYGGLELALSLALPGQDPHMVAVCDNYGPARVVLAAHWPEAAQFKDVRELALDSVQADVVTFGFPCQDLSRAGHGAGIQGSRSGLFFRCAEVGHMSGAQALVIENVPQALKYRETIDEELARYGFSVRWGRAEAWEAGLPHRRARVFLVAVRNGGEGLLQEDKCPSQTPERPSDLLPTPTVVDMGWGHSPEAWETWREAQRRKHGNGNGHGQSLYQALGCPAPEQATRAMERMMGLPEGWVTGQGLKVSAERRLLGNGVAPAQGALGIWRALNSPI
nr:MAG TPA: Cytosine specific methyltransferase [Caudoviricetes sp.]